ncbi:MAG: peptide deformylase [Candidatus Zixiibacteriota bacterium]
MIQEIRLYGDEVLRRPADDVCDFGATLQQLASDLLMTQAAAKAVGVAAVQIGVEQNVFSIDGSTVERRGRREVLVNPQVVETHGEVVEEEGCLSFPGIFVPIRRPEWVAIRAQNLDGKEIEREATGYLARAYLHEIDHLRGRLFTDLMDADTRRDVIRRMRSIRARERSGTFARFFPFARATS